MDKNGLRRRFFAEERRIYAFTNPAMLRLTFDKDDGSNPRLMTAARNYAERFAEFKAMKKGLLLYGDVGTGKSFAAACIVNHVIEQGFPARFTNFAEIEKEKNIARLNRYDLLVLDDFATERNTGYMNELVFAVIDSRVQSGLPMIVTTNLTADELKKTSDPDRAKVLSRLLGACEPIKVDGDDRRRGQLRKDHNTVKTMLGL